jgi:hypothetical protein
MGLLPGTTPFTVGSVMEFANRRFDSGVVSQSTNWTAASTCLLLALTV